MELWRWTLDSTTRYLDAKMEDLLVLDWAARTAFTPFVYILGLPMVVYHILLSRFWPLVFLYTWWYYYDRKSPVQGGYKSRLYCYHPMYRTIRRYFSAKLVKTADLDPAKNYILGAHPHGVHSPSMHANFFCASSEVKKLFPGMTTHFATINMFFKVPFFREMVMNLGGVAATNDSLEHLLSEGSGKLLVLFPGGAAESVLARPHRYQLILEKRKGFVKLALKTGCPLVPMIGFGDHEIYERADFDPKSSKFSQWFKQQTGFIFNQTKNLVPIKVPVTSVVGKPIEVPKLPNPTKEEVEHYHGLYKEELIRLFNEHKTKYLEKGDQIQLEIVE